MIRRATTYDIDSIARIHLAAETASALGTSRENLVRSTLLSTKIETWRKSLEDPLVTVLIGSHNDIIRGFAAIGPFRSDAGIDLNIGEVYTIFVDPKYFRRAVATNLFKHSLSEAALKDRKAIRLWVYEENATARAFYEKMGFSLTGTSKEINNTGVIARAVLYERTA